MAALQSLHHKVMQFFDWILLAYLENKLQIPFLGMGEHIHQMPVQGFAEGGQNCEGFLPYPFWSLFQDLQDVRYSRSISVAGQRMDQCQGYIPARFLMKPLLQGLTHLFTPDYTQPHCRSHTCALVADREFADEFIVQFIAL